MKVTDLTKALRGKIGWVSLSPDDKKLIAQARTLKMLVKKLQKLGNPDGHIMYLSAGEFSSYVG